MDNLIKSQTIRVAVCDLNGQARGKRVPASYAKKLDQGAVRIPLSTLNVDIRGQDIVGSPLVFASGDADGILRPTRRGPVAMPWLDCSGTLYPMELYHDDGKPFAGDPRHALTAILAQFAARGWQVHAAVELEFTLVDDSPKGNRTTITPPKDPRSGRALCAADVLSLDALDTFDRFFTDIYAAAKEMGIPALAAISESGLGQFEINLAHCDALRAADDAWLAKMLIRGMARKHGMCASFMAKPYAQDAGNGLHVHFSVVDAQGRNIFDNGGPEGTSLLRNAIAGCLAAMADSTLIFAPHAGSYSRLVPGQHAPTGIGWGYENRTAAIRVPGGATGARRIEHRVAGGDVNPYLLLAAVLGAAMLGIKDAMIPPAPLTGNAYEADLAQLCPDWGTAIRAFATSDLIRRIFPDSLIRNFVLTKKQELTVMETLSPEARTALYLERV